MKTKTPPPTPRPGLDPELQRIVEARHHDPLHCLGRHSQGTQDVVRVYRPDCQEIRLKETGAPLQRVSGTDLFEWHGDASGLAEHYQLEATGKDGVSRTFHDPYTFSPSISDYDLYLFGEGHHLHIYTVLGAHCLTIDGVTGVRFATWAPNAERVSVIGDFNRWDGRTHPMTSRGGSGVWELFVPGLDAGTIYKFEIRNRNSGQVKAKADPYANGSELRPRTASVVNTSRYQWNDRAWLAQREEQHWLHHPMSIYEVHLGSWQQDAQGHFLNYRELAKRLVEYVTRLGFTHIELLPITEHPLDASWGYQTTGYFCPTRRFGEPDDFRWFVDHCHQHGIGVLLDWVPAHFPRDAHGLAFFDGSALYEHADPRRGEHPDWGTLIYNYGRNEVRNFLISSAIYWLKEFHIDGLRVDAVASMLYLDYSREGREWLPNIHGGNENLEAIEFIRELNTVTHREHPGTVVMAEESTAWPAVTRPTSMGGLGFSMKWNMGWMHDTLVYFSKEPVHRTYHHDQLTFGLLYAFTENFILPFSHDEVVHGKSSMLYKMPGDEWQRFANLRLLYTYMFTYPGKKLLFMGTEFGQGSEWNFNKALDWYVLDYAGHQGVQKVVSDLNRLYREQPALYRHEFEYSGFEWIDCHDSRQSVISYLRKDGDRLLLVALNFTPVPRVGYRLGVPRSGNYREIFNSDSEYYHGTNMGNGGGLHSEAIPWMNREHSLCLTLPPLAGIVLELTD
ncbi:MAG: 1,4-alpha-glucan branching protein GlgB [Gammaproteobacteria bacterium]|jgi:1,4-alpha-glucan branching enzyme